MRLAAPDRRQQIIETAMELFSKQGFDGTTTREIARQAGINEALLFRHFETKSELYSSVLEESCKLKVAKLRLAENLQAEGDDLEIFAAAAEDYLRRNSADSSITRLVLFSALEGHRLSRRLFQALFGDYYELLAENIRQRVADGRFRDVDPVLAARGFAGMVVYHHLVQDVFGGKRFQKYDVKETARFLAGLWLSGMTAKDSVEPAIAGRRPERNKLARNGGGEK